MDIKNFLIQNIIWEILFSLFIITLLWKKIIKRWWNKYKIKRKSKEIAKNLLSKNREYQRGGGQHEADRFVDIYHSSPERPIRKKEKVRNWTSESINIWVIDDKLINDYKLAETYQKGNQEIIKLKNTTEDEKLLADCIYREIRKKLIESGDNPNFYNGHV